MLRPPIGVSEDLCAEADVNVGAVHGHSRAGVGLVEQLYAGIPIYAAVGGAEIEYAGSIVVWFRTGLPAKDMDGIADCDKVGAANFLPGLRDADRAAPSCTVVGGFAKI